MTTLPTTNKRTICCDQCSEHVAPGRATFRASFRGDYLKLCPTCEAVETALDETEADLEHVQRLAGLDFIDMSAIRRNLRELPAASIPAVVAEISNSVRAYSTGSDVLAMIRRAYLQTRCSHRVTVTEMSGGYSLSFGEATDDISEITTCAACGKIISAVDYIRDIDY